MPQMSTTDQVLQMGWKIRWHQNENWFLDFCTVLQTDHIRDSIIDAI